jgi:hypothetical protein
LDPRSVQKSSIRASLAAKVIIAVKKVQLFTLTTVFPIFTPTDSLFYSILLFKYYFSFFLFFYFFIYFFLLILCWTTKRLEQTVLVIGNGLNQTHMPQAPALKGEPIFSTGSAVALLAGGHSRRHPSPAKKEVSASIGWLEFAGGPSQNLPRSEC